MNKTEHNNYTYFIFQIAPLTVCFARMARQGESKAFTWIALIKIAT